MQRILALALGAVLLAACSVGSAASPPAVLDVVIADDWASAPVVRQVVRDFERTHDVRVEVQAAPFSQIPDLVANAVEIGDPFDLAHWHAFAAAADDLAQPLDEAWDEAGLTADHYLPGAVDDVTWEGRRYGVPLDVNALVLLVNPAVLAASGVEEADLADVGSFLEAAARLQEAGHVEHAITATASTWSAYGWIRAFGGDVLAADDGDEVRFTFDDPRTVAAVEMLGELATSSIATPPFAPDMSLDAIGSLTDGTVALHASGSWDLPVTRRAHALTEEVAVLPLPRGDGDTGTVLGGSSLFVPHDARDPDLGFELALALTQRDVGLALAEEEGRLPALVDVYDDELFRRDRRLEAFVAQLPEADVMPLIAYPALHSAFGTALERVLKGQEDAHAALTDLQRLAERTGGR